MKKPINKDLKRFTNKHRLPTHLFFSYPDRYFSLNKRTFGLNNNTCDLDNNTCRLNKSYLKINKSIRHAKPSLISHVIFCSLFGLSVSASASIVGINELHYDNAGADINEGVELVGPSGFAIDDWSLHFYNGNNGEVYTSVLLAGTFENAEAPQASTGLGFLSFSVEGLQNGPADGVALVDANGVLQSFLSYEGVIAATTGPAEGQSSIDIGAAQSGTNLTGLSLQRNGTIRWDGNQLSFIQSNWALTDASWGALNANQEVENLVNPPNPVPIPGAALLFGSALLSTGLLKRRAS